MFRRGLTLRLTALVFAGGAFVVALMLGYNYHVARQLILAQTERSAANLAESAVNHVQTVLQSAAQVPDYVSALLARHEYGETETRDLARTVVEANAATYGSTIAFEPYAFDTHRLYFAPYYYRERPGSIAFRWLGSARYRYFTMDWFQLPRELGRAVWSEPYFDEGGGNILMATYSVPFTHTVAGEARFAGVVTADIALAWLEAYIASIRISQTGYAFLLSKAGTVITHPRRELVMNESIFSLAEANHDARLRQIGRDMVSGNAGVARTRSLVTDRDSWVVYAPVPASGWTLAVVFPEDELLGEVIDLTQAELALAAGGGTLLLLVVVGIARSITRPLVELSLATEEIARGNLDSPLPQVHSKDEVGVLAAAFRRMQQDLKAYMQEHDQLLAIRSELDVAARIQHSILPREFPPFPDHPELEIFAEMLPAREVGGDFYDLFRIDASRVGVAIGDVSGKGVPAALFMAVTRTLLRSVAMTARPPGECLKRVNNLLCLENSAEMFVSLFYAVLNMETGLMEYGNGGHNPPYILRSGGGIEPLPGTGGMVLGVLSDLGYDAAVLQLYPGDTLFLYTDGVTEAMDPEGALFTDERVRTVLTTVSGATPRDTIRAMLTAVHEWAAAAPQSDDITSLACRWLGEPKTGCS